MDAIKIPQPEPSLECCKVMPQPSSNRQSLELLAIATAQYYIVCQEGAYKDRHYFIYNSTPGFLAQSLETAIAKYISQPLSILIQKLTKL